MSDAPPVQLRFATFDDLDGMYEIYAPIVERTAISFETVPPPVPELAERLADTMPAYPWLVAIEDARVLGYAYGHRFATRAAYAWSVETSIYLDEHARGRGIGTRLYDALLRLLGAQGYHQAFAGIALPNAASVGLHESAGFRLVGTFERVGFKFGRWHDVGWWQRPVSAALDHPHTPLAVDALDRALVDDALRSRSS